MGRFLEVVQFKTRAILDVDCRAAQSETYQSGLDQVRLRYGHGKRT